MSGAESWVRPCSDCDGAGLVWNGRGRGGNDPDSWEVDCDTCDGVGHFPCEACGHDKVVEGYDCFICDTVGATMPVSTIVTPEVLARYRDVAREMVV